MKIGLSDEERDILHEMKIEKMCGYDNRIKVFVWWPTKTYNGRIVWLEKVYRAMYYSEWFEKFSYTYYEIEKK